MVQEHREQVRQRGGQPGNQNARTHGFYSKYLPPEVQDELDNAVTVEGLDEEILLLRAKIAVAAKDPAQSAFLLSGISLLSRLLRTREKLGYSKQGGLQQAIFNLLNNVPAPIAESIKNIWRKEGIVIPAGNEPTAELKTNPNECPTDSENKSV